MTVFDPGLPEAQGLYSPQNEHDACGVGFVANMHNKKSHDIVEMGLNILLNLDHRGAVGADPKAGDGCGMLVADSARFPRRGSEEERPSSCRRSANTPSVICSCRWTRRAASSSPRSSSAS
jgi:glutamate synthase domain-containing protein 1